MIHLKLSSEPLDIVESDLALVLAYEDERPLKGQTGLIDWRLNGKVSKLILDKRFDGKFGDALLMPSEGRAHANELVVLGLGHKSQLDEARTPRVIQYIIETLLKKKARSFALSLSDLVSDKFEWRNTVRTFISALSGREEDFQITLIEPDDFVDDARRRHMDFAYDVQVVYS